MRGPEPAEGRQPYTFWFFMVELMSGGRIHVEHPEALAFGDGQAAYVSPDGSLTLFDHESVSRLEDRSSPP